MKDKLPIVIETINILTDNSKLITKAVRAGQAAGDEEGKPAKVPKQDTIFEGILRYNIRELSCYTVEIFHFVKNLARDGAKVPKQDTTFEGILRYCIRELSCYTVKKNHFVKNITRNGACVTCLLNIAVVIVD